MINQQKFYDVYVSYPPGDDPERVNECLRDNLSEEEANDIINALAEQKQAIIAERCTNEERENAQHYFTYLGLDVIIRLSLELADDGSSGNDSEVLADPVPQCPVCYSILENPDVKECPTCGLQLNTTSEQQIQRKRIEWQERVAFEHRKKHEIAYKLLREKQEEEKQLRKQIRAELEQQLRSELGRYQGWRKWLYGKYAIFTMLLLGIFLIVLLALIFVISGFVSFKTQKEVPVETQNVSQPVDQARPVSDANLPKVQQPVMAAPPPGEHSQHPVVQESPTSNKQSLEQNKIDDSVQVTAPAIVPMTEPQNNDDRTAK
ncbi:hypothetical protein [Neisseria wadsworthii]|uniref:Uncharacterized protein n=1 Tax=Neisseria wadsworthii 9715 TaxID=1030841 RepID=G4CRT8_9NEIS|nr:hypothetical protein [Neisseria wadsworthii]EGZ45239.1 hypothetical protein HMPREF9370_1798 [Neisseria wadsworthii 9715]QMT35471.1 hypothetical protein H3L96_10615 [Neisseria wadsworthii]